MDKLELTKQLKTWYMDTPGQQLAEFESYYISHALHTLFGYHSLHLGDLGSKDWMESSSIRYPICLSESGEGVASMPIIQGLYNDLPIQASSIDAVLLPHILEFELKPEQVLEEIQRVLVPHGYAIIMGFNPSSLWGIWRGMTRLCGRDQAILPWQAQGNFHSIFQMRRFLNEKDFDLIDIKTFFFRPPISNSNGLLKLRFLEILGQFFWAYGGGVYLLVAQKRVIGATPIQLSWRERWVKTSQLWPEPVARCKQR
jgi:SAM-dependent methyltransferase